MKPILIIILFGLCTRMLGQGLDTLRIDTTTFEVGSFIPDSLWSSKFTLSDGPLSFYDPCKATLWPIIFTECPNNPMHCRHCAKEIKKGESFAYVVMEVKNNQKFADYIHIRCSLKRIK